MSTVEARARQVKSFAAHADLYPWQWTAQVADEYFADLRAVRGCTRSTVRGYQVAIRGFCAYVTDPAYGWAAACETRFGTHPVQVINEVNAAVHVADVESEPTRRAFTQAELQDLFDFADEQVARKRAFGRKGHLAAFRDATMLKVAYSFSLRRAEARMLDVTDFGRNPAAAEYFGEVRPLLVVDGNPAAWPSERGARIGVEVLSHRLSAYRDALGLDRRLDFHSLRRSYVTHLIEDG